MGCCLTGLAYTASASELTPVELDLQSRPTNLRYPYSASELKLFESLPSRFYLNAYSEVSERLETNPFQAPGAFKDPYIEDTWAFRVQNNVTAGYALTPRDRVSLSFFNLVNRYDNFAPFRLDSTSYTIAPSYQHVWYQDQEGWQVSSNFQMRQTILANGNDNGGLLPSTTIVKSMGKAGYAFFNGALDLSRRDFALGDLDFISPSATLGYGWQMPYDSKHRLLRPLGGLGVSLFSTYTYTSAFNSDFPNPNQFQSIFLSAEVYKPLYRKSRVSAFVRSENVFNFGVDRDAFGVSGTNYRLFGGLRIALNKPAVFMRELPYGLSSSRP